MHQRWNIQNCAETISLRLSRMTMTQTTNNDVELWNSVARYGNIDGVKCLLEHLSPDYDCKNTGGKEDFLNFWMGVWMSTTVAMGNPQETMLHEYDIYIYLKFDVSNRCYEL